MSDEDGCEVEFIDGKGILRRGIIIDGEPVEAIKIERVKDGRKYEEYYGNGKPIYTKKMKGNWFKDEGGNIQTYETVADEWRGGV